MQSDPLEDSEMTTILVVRDIAQSTDWYTSVLGAEVFRKYGGDSVVLKCLGQWLLLVTPGGPTADKPRTHFVVPSQPERVDHSFTIRVEDCHVSYEALKEKGAEFLTPPYERGAETRCFFRDPDGHLFEISAYAG